MRNALPIPQEEILSVVEQDFGRHFVDLEFLPLGETGWLYKAHAPTGEPFALKVQDEPDPTIAAICTQLEQQGYPWMPPLVLNTQGEMWTKKDTHSYSVQTFIETDRALLWNEDVSPEFLEQTGKMLRDLHDVPVSEELKRTALTENFHDLFLDRAIDTVNKILALEPADEPAERTKQVIADNMEVFQKLCQYSVDLGNQLRAKSPRLVITHGDVHFANVLAPANDHIYLIDWDVTMLALPENDLNYFSNEQLKHISRGYGEDRPFDPIAVEYYRAARTIRTMWFWPSKILYATDPEERAHAARYMEAAYQPGEIVDQSFIPYKP